MDVIACAAANDITFRLSASLNYRRPENKYSLSEEFTPLNGDPEQESRRVV